MQHRRNLLKTHLIETLIHFYCFRYALRAKDYKLAYTFNVSFVMSLPLAITLYLKRLTIYS